MQTISRPNPSIFGIITQIDRDIARAAGNQRGETVSTAVGRTIAAPFGASPQIGTDVFHIALGAAAGALVSSNPKVIGACALAGLCLRFWPSR